jgi:hypothetical protein
MTPLAIVRELQRGDATPATWNCLPNTCWILALCQTKAPIFRPTRKPGKA